MSPSLIPQTPAHQLPQGAPMDVDQQQCSAISTQPFATFHGNCYNCRQAGHLAKDCPPPHPHYCGVQITPSPLYDEASRYQEDK